MKVKTTKLEGPALDWAVAMCEGDGVKYGARSYSTDWAVGGPIIEKERIRLDFPWEDQCDAAHPDSRHTAKKDGWTGWVAGPTPLIAAMRCYVASKLGDEVEIPEGLI